MAKASKLITPRSEDYSRWYTDIVQRAELADYAPVKGCMVIRPYGYAIWEHIKEALDRRFKATGHQNAYFPLFIPESYFKKEAQHVEGFAPECAVVTHGGGQKLEEPLYVRPTSETIIYDMYSRWVSSWRDLPILINQWANVVRWEMRTRLFLRTTEFLWQEGHTAHATHEEAIEEALRMLEVYREVLEEVMAVPVIKGQKSDSERFAGAHVTYAVEAMMQNKWALQAGTSHDLGQNFARAFNLSFQDQNKEMQFAWNTSWGVSTRLVGGLIMTHSDDAGLVLPPAVAPIQIVVVPIWRSDEEQVRVLASADALIAQLRDIDPAVRVKLDDRDTLRPGAKFFEWERKGVPLRVELGPRDVEAETLVVTRRDLSEKQTLERANAASRLMGLLADVQRDLFERACAFRAANSHQAEDWESLCGLLGEEGPGGFVHVRWCGNPECETRFKDTFKATTRCIPFDAEPDPGPCIVCSTNTDATAKRIVVARAY